MYFDMITNAVHKYIWYKKSFVIYLVVLIDGVLRSNLNQVIMYIYVLSILYYIQTSIKIINRILRLSELFQQYYKVTNKFGWLKSSC